MGNPQGRRDDRKRRGQHYKAQEKKKTVVSLRDELRSLHDIAWVLSVKNSSLSGWNRLFGKQLNALHVTDRRGKNGKITAELEKKVVKIALQEINEGKRLRIKSFTQKLAEQRIVL